MGRIDAREIVVTNENRPKDRNGELDGVLPRWKGLGSGADETGFGGDWGLNSEMVIFMNPLIGKNYPKNFHMHQACYISISIIRQAKEIQAT